MTTSNEPKGFIKIFRSIRTHWLWSDEKKLKWWLDILFEANWQDKKVLIGSKLVDCKRGQCVVSQRSWAKRWRVTQDTVSAFIKLLVSDGMIEVETVHKTSRITICKYDTYNDSPFNNSGKDRSISRAIAVRSLVTTEESKEYKERKECKKEYKPMFSSLLLEAKFSEWLDYRKERRLATASSTIKKQVEFLSTYSEREAIAIIDQAIANGWQGLFPLKQPLQPEKPVYVSAISDPKQNQW